jgi:hypothetical protein
MSFSERRAESHTGAEVVWSARLPDSTLLSASQGTYLAQITYDADGTLRRLRKEARFARMDLLSIPERLSGFEIDDAIPILFPSVDRPIPIVSYGDVLGGDPEALKDVAGRFVFVGLVEDPLTDAVNVPREQQYNGNLLGRVLPGVVTLAAATETLLRGAPIRDASWFGALLWNLLWCSLVVLLPPNRRPRLAFLIVGVIGLCAILSTGAIHVFVDLIFPAGLLFGCIFTCGLHLIIGTHLETAKALHAEEIENERVHRELATARRTQKRFLPERLPELEGIVVWGRNLSSLEVSGDYYDVIDRGDESPVVIAIGDVSGKGLPAALLMSNVQAGLHTCFYSGRSTLESAATNLNRLVYENTTASEFVTFFLGELDKQTHILRYVRAGHDIPFVISESGAVRDLEEGGVVFGFLPDVTYPVGSLQFAPGDVLCLYTDGITEARRGEEEYGLDRLVDVVRSNRTKGSAEIGDAILAHVTQFTGQTGRSDDMTLIVVHF